MPMLRAPRFALAPAWTVAVLIALTAPACELSSPAEAPGELLEGTAAREDPDVDDAVLDALTADQRDFAFALFEELRGEQGEDENLFVSPYSIASALAMTYAGAAGQTRAEMAEALRFRLPEEDFHPAVNELARALQARVDAPLDEGQILELHPVNQAWGQAGYPFLDAYLDVLSRHYGADLRAADFRADAERIREEINAWVEDRTEGHIDELLPEGGVDELTRFVLVNAIYFHATWQDTFDSELTEDRAFTLEGGAEVEAPMMRHSRPTWAGYYAGPDTTAVSLPYAGGELAMLVLKPAEEGQDFGAWERELDGEAFGEIASELENAEGFIELPAFEDEGEFSLIPALEALGMEEAFDPRAADFGELVDLDEADERLHISGVFHQTFIDVDEDGTEAAAATGAVGGATSLPDPNFEVAFDRPFVYGIYDRDTGALLFLGRLADPS